MATAYPVRYLVERPARFTRLQLLVRFVAFCALGVLGITFGTVFAFAYLALPVFAAVRLSGGREPEAYLHEDGQRLVRALGWFAAFSAWFALVAERLPGRSSSDVVAIEVDDGAKPDARKAIWRVVSGLPSALVLVLLCMIGTLVWLWAALSILVHERVGDGTHDYLIGLQRWAVRLLAYQASLVDDYPPFSFEEAPAPLLPTARTTARTA
ncbi:MAG TPA: DUF4389 domain-containing protein [Kofleriaceae bacterium]|nr:DUF4389 domain-containing protein [Kofleriaceae bacterium]